MSPKEALVLLDQVCSQIQANRQGHDQLTTAINVLHQLIEFSQASLANAFTAHSPETE